MTTPKIEIRDDCTQCQEWELCPFHPKGRAEPPKPAAPAPAPSPAVVVPADWVFLGLDDPEVLGPDTPPDLIYATPGGGVVGVPATLASVTKRGVT